MPETTAQPLAFPFDDDPGLAPPAELARLRDHAPVARVRLPFGEPAWLVTRYEDVRLVLRDARFSRAAAKGKDAPRVSPFDDEQGILSLDPPDHTALRNLVAGAFTVRRIDALRDRTRRLAESLVADIAAGEGLVDLVGSFALPLSVGVLCELLGVPATDQERIVHWAEAFHSTKGLTGEEIGRRAMELHDYLATLVRARLSEPTDDVLGIAARSLAAAPQGLTEEDLTWLAVGLVGAGYETTSAQLSNSLFLLLAESGRWTWLAGHPDRIGAAVEELLRFVPLQTAGVFSRYALEDVEIGGVLVRAGDAVVVDLTSANRDATAFDRPDVIDLERQSNPHVAFGHGIHHCLGAALARMELAVGLETLATRLPGLALAAPTTEVGWLAGAVMRAPAALPAHW